MMDWLYEWDLWLFQWVNHQGEWEALNFLPVLSNLHNFRSVTRWLVPLVVLWILWRFRSQGLRGLLAVSLAAGTADLISTRLLKDAFDRKRPHHEMATTKARLRLDFSPTSPSFPSNHAFNTMAGATVLALMLPGWSWVFYLIAFTVSYSRVYVGVHYPSDVIVGMLFGWLLARILWWSIIKKWIWCKAQTT